MLADNVHLDALLIDNNCLTPDYLLHINEAYGKLASTFSYAHQTSHGLLRWSKVNANQYVYSLVARIDSLHHEWYMNGALKKSGLANQYVANKSDQGLLECVISHPQLPGLTYSYEAYLNVNVPKEQVEALSQLYYEMQGDKWYSNAGWDQIRRGKRMPRYFSGLKGVQFDVDGNVTQLDLSNNHLRGYVPDLFNRFTHLSKVDLSHNMIGGFQLDQPFGAQVETIDLSHNILKDFSLSLANLEGLRYLDVGHNVISSFKPILVKDSKLETIVISENRLDSIGFTNKLTNLKKLDVDNNRIHYIDIDFSDCNSIDTIDLSGNRLKFENLTPLLYKLPKKVGKLITGHQDVWYNLEYDQGLNAVYIGDVLEKTCAIEWYKAGEKQEVKKHFISLKKEFYRDYDAIITNPFFPGTTLKALWNR